MLLHKGSSGVRDSLLLGGKAVFAYMEGRIESERLIDSPSGQHRASMRAMHQALRLETHKIASDAMESFSALDVMLLLNRGLVPYLHLPNFGPGVGMPELALGKAGEDEVEARLKNIKTVIKEIGLPGSKTQIYEEARMIAPDPNDPDDVLGGEEKDNTSTVTAVSQLQAQVKGAQVDRDAAIENVTLFLKITQEEAAKLFPVPPPQPMGQPGVVPGQPPANGQQQPGIGQGLADLVNGALGQGGQTFSADVDDPVEAEVQRILKKARRKAA